MIIIVEGQDRCGKDTLIKQIKKDIIKNPLVITLHCSSPPKDVDAEEWSKDHYSYLLAEASRLSDAGWTVIFNRSHLGEDVYGPIFRGVNSNYIYNFENLYLPLDKTKMIVLVDEPPGLIDREDGESLSTTYEQYEDVKNSFICAYNKSNIKDKILYNVSNDGGFPNLFPTIKEFLNNNAKS